MLNKKYKVDSSIDITQNWDTPSRSCVTYAEGMFHFEKIRIYIRDEARI